MLIINEHCQSYYPHSRRKKPHHPLGAWKALPFATDSTCPNHSIGSRKCFQSRHCQALRRFQTYRATMARPFFSAAFVRLGERCPSARTNSPHQLSKGLCNYQYDTSTNSLQCYPLECTLNGQRTWRQQSDHLAYLETAQSKTSFGQNKLSRDKQFIEKLYDVVGLYLNPPDKALVLCVDEKSQIQALDRTQPGLPMKPGRCGTMTHDYKRNGTTTLFAALSMLDGKVIGDCMPRHRHQEFIRFLQLINTKTPDDLDLHLIVDNYGTHKHPRVQSWLKRHQRFHLHFIPTSSSWLNMVERWFREITDKRIRRGSFKNVPDLIAAIRHYIETHNQNPRVFVWSASAEKIMAKISKCKEALETLH
jgi:transposase